MEKLSGLRTILICLIVMHGIWFTVSALNIVGFRVYEIIPPTVYSLLTAASNVVEIIFYVLLLTALPALTRGRD